MANDMLFCRAVAEAVENLKGDCSLFSRNAIKLMVKMLITLFVILTTFVHYYYYYDYELLFIISSGQRTNFGDIRQ